MLYDRMAAVETGIGLRWMEHKENPYDDTDSN